MTSSLEGEGGVGQKMTCDDMMTQGGGGEGTDDEISFFLLKLEGSP